MESQNIDLIEEQKLDLKKDGKTSYDGSTSYGKLRSTLPISSYDGSASYSGSPSYMMFSINTYKDFKDVSCNISA